LTADQKSTGMGKKGVRWPRIPKCGEKGKASDELVKAAMIEGEGGLEDLQEEELEGEEEKRSGLPQGRRDGQGRKEKGGGGSSQHMKRERLKHPSIKPRRKENVKSAEVTCLSHRPPKIEETCRYLNKIARPEEAKVCWIIAYGRRGERTGR